MRSLNSHPHSHMTSSPSPSPPPQNTTPSTDPHFWSPPSTWDILSLGHCFSPSSTLSPPFLPYIDPFTPPLASLTPPTAALLASFNLSSARLLYRSTYPLCTFAYAVTRASAARILKEFGREGDGGCVAYDVRVLEACRDRGWRCWAVAPEVFHHVEGRSEIASVNDDMEGRKGEEDGRGKPRGKTANIECGARDEVLWVGEKEARRRRWMVARARAATARGECFADELREGKARVSRVY